MHKTDPHSSSRCAPLARPILLCGLAGTLAFSAQAAPHHDPVAEARIGVLDHATQLTTSGVEGGLDLNLEVLFSPTVVPWSIPGSPYVNLGASFNDDAHNTDQLYGGLTWELRVTDRVFGRFAGGLAIHDGELHRGHEDERALGQRVLFRASFELGRRIGRHHALALVYDHISNGPLSGPNQGIDNLGVRYSYRF